MASIRVVFPLIFIGQIFLGIGINTFIYYKNQKEALEETAFQIVDPLIETMEKQMEKRLQIPAQIVKAFSYQLVEQEKRHSINLKQAGETEMLKTIEHYMWEISHVYFDDLLQSLMIATPEGVYMEMEKINSENEDPKYVFRDSDVSNSGILYTYSLNKEGRIKTLINSQDINYDPRETIYYQAALEAKKEVWTPAYFSMHRNNSYFVSLVKPVYDVDNNLLAVVGSDMELRNISKDLEQLKISADSLIFIFNSSGRLIGTSEIEPLETIGKDGIKRWISVLDSKNSITRQISENIKARFNSFDVTENIEEKIKIDNKDYFFKLDNLQENGLDWHIVFMIPEQDLAAVNELENNIIHSLYISIFMIILGVVLGIITARWLIRPILTLSAVADNISGNNYDNQQEINNLTKDTRRKDEFGQLAQIFAKMIEEIKSHSAQLKAQIEQLRVDIDHKKKNDQVKEITETDFFRDLKSRGKTLRQQRKARISDS